MRPATLRSSSGTAAHLGRLFVATLAAMTVALALVIAALRVAALAVGAEDPAEVANLALATTLDQRAPLLAVGLVGLATIIASGILLFLAALAAATALVRWRGRAAHTDVPTEGGEER